MPVEITVAPDLYNETEALAARAKGFIVFDMPDKRNPSALSAVTVEPRIEVNPPGILPPFVGNYTHLIIERYRMYVFERLYNQEKKFKFMTVVRDPIDRFLAAFTDKCYYEAKRVTYEKTVCQEVGCGDDLECFIKQMHKRLWGVVKGTHAMNVMDWHVMPMTWTCDMRNYLNKFKYYKYAPKGTPGYEKFLADFKDTLRERDVPQDKIDHIMESMTTKNSPHTTTGSSMRSKFKAKIMARPDLLKILVDLYYFDYKIFNYPFPKGYDLSTKGSQV
ncbi:unnamed protein product [Bursaphelenchus xylophilus]|uniref:(pine wood nematode) hypothetical protein n=1 Tax=Bursaphelenchus xylophilus TaxID=6326 RepID=A0A1I7S4N8_BURXY|nr:unnamed protein product [Bursaphelenchus xylophilus]CAG9117262.1 unnamed protein product [Bursaphelenchus xylophilus]